MRKDHKPLIVRQLLKKINRWYVERFIRPQFDSLGIYPEVLSPTALKLFGHNIHAGDHLHIISSRNNPVNISCWTSKQQAGEILIGHRCLISPGTTITSAESISIGNDCMIAANCYISDSDWHGLYNRIRPFRCTAPISLANNVWVGYGSIIQKGIRIGENSVIAAGSVVTTNVPANSVYGGNPAKLIKTLNPKRRMLTREFLFTDQSNYEKNQSTLDQYSLHSNSFLGWLRALISPSKQD